MVSVNLILNNSSADLKVTLDKLHNDEIKVLYLMTFI